MIYWMSERTRRLLDEYNITVIGFDPEKSGRFAWCKFVFESEDDGTLVTNVCLGDVRGLSYEQMDRRFAAAVLHLALSEDRDCMFADGDDVKKLYELADKLLARDCDVG